MGGAGNSDNNIKQRARRASLESASVSIEHCAQDCSAAGAARNATLARGVEEEEEEEEGAQRQCKKYERSSRRLRPLPSGTTPCLKEPSQPQAAASPHPRQDGPSPLLPPLPARA
ncbi:unnamed protein product [Prorocentrum cordatum]|uniref:Uncharacterized protein n=1 Tax=Prorocentrum cordatum TaxID=2364126 RepID=A0ABN9U2B8_9DINO|nr:unnamed protein product [Polarella glacialis]